MKFKNLVVVSPDRGGVLRTTGFARLLNASDIAFVYKMRDIHVNSKLNALGFIGEVEGKNVVMVDDIISTAGTIAHAADLLKARGAKSVHVAAAHGLFTGNAHENIKNSGIDEVFITDSVQPSEEVLKNPKIKIASVAPMLAETIKRIRTGASISTDLIL